MDKQRFDEILAAYGAAPRRWPQAERADAEALARQDPGAAALARGARAIDHLLDAGRSEADVSALSGRVLRRYQARRAAAPIWALAASALIGVALGFSAGRSAPAADGAERLMGAAFELPLETGGEAGEETGG